MHNKTIPASRALTRRKSTAYRMDIDPTQWRVFMQAVQNGMKVESAARLAGLPIKTAWNWLKRGETLEELEADILPHSQSAQYLRFWQEFNRSKALFEGGHLKNINDHAVVDDACGDWKASAWALEHGLPKVYGNQYAIERTSDQKLIQFVRYVLEWLPDVGNPKEEFSKIVQSFPHLSESENDD